MVGKCPPGNKAIFMFRIHTFFFYMMTLLLSMNVLAANIQVQIDRNPVALGESFQLIFSVNQTPDSDPDFRPLDQNFSVLGQSSNSKISMINGVSSRTLSWTVAVMAKTAGIQWVPAISFGSDHSRRVKIEVKDKSMTPATATAHQSIFLQVTVEPKNPYVQAQAIYTMKLYHQVEIAQARLDEPTLEDAIIEKLGKDANYRTTFGGKAYHVVERKYAVFPQKSGALTFPPLTLQAQVVTGHRSGLGGFFGRRDTRMNRLQSNSITLDVQPIPTEFTGRHWLPAEDLQLSENWSADPSGLSVGEPVTRTIALHTKGVTAGQLPELSLLQPIKSEADRDTIKRYPDQPTLQEEKEPNGITSLREEKTAMIPSQPGDYVLASIEIPWWNTKTNKMEVARLPEQLMSVATGSTVNTAVPAVNVNPISAVKQTGVDLPTILQSPIQQQGYWKWLAIAVATGWLATGLLWWYLHRRLNRKSVKTQPEKSVVAGKEAVKKLKKACAEHTAQQAKEALLIWAKSRWSELPPTSLGAIQSRCEGALQFELVRLNQSLYQQQAEPWSGTALWRAFKLQQNDPSMNTDKDTRTETVILQPLYKTV